MLVAGFGGIFFLGAAKGWFAQGVNLARTGTGKTSIKWYLV